MLIAALACTPSPSPSAPRPGTPPSTSAPAEPAPGPAPGDGLFGGAFVHQVELSLAPGAYETLLASPDTWVVADVTVDGEEVQAAGVRLKGGGSFRPIDDQPSFKIEFDQFVDGQELDGLDELTLNNMVLDPSRVRERTAYEVYRRVGIPAPRAVHATVTLDGRALGPYLVVEAQDGRFFDRWYADGDGSRYEMFDVDFVEQDVPLFDHDGGPDDRTPLYGVADALADPAAPLAPVDAWLDLDGFAAYFGASAVIGQFDAYPYSFPGDDLVLYVDPADGRIDVLPHGADETFADAERPVDYVFGRLGARCLDDPDCAYAWEASIWDTAAALEALGPFVDAIRDELGPDGSDAAIDEVLAFVDGRGDTLASMSALRP